MNQPREVIFAGAGFAGDEEGRRRRRNFFGEREQALRAGISGNPRETLRHKQIVAGRAKRKERCIEFNCAKGHGTRLLLAAETISLAQALIGLNERS